MKPEIIKDMPFDDYIDVDACQKSALKNVETAKDLKKYREKKLDNDALRFGRIFHTAILEPNKFKKKKFEIYDDQDWIPKGEHKYDLSQNDQKQLWKDYNRAYEIEYYKNKAEIDAIKAMSEAILTDPLASKYLSGKGEAELSLFWDDPKTGLRCKTRLDWLRYDDVIVELKSDANPEPVAFGKKVYNMNYHVGAWFNREGFRACFERDISAFVYIVNEKDDPWTIGTYSMNAHDFDGGEIDGYPQMKRYQMIKAGGFKDHNQGEDGEYTVLPLQTPGWEEKRIDDAMGEIEV